MRRQRELHDACRLDHASVDTATRPGRARGARSAARARRRHPVTRRGEAIRLSEPGYDRRPALRLAHVRWARLGAIPLGGEAGNTHYDDVSHCIVVAIQTRNELVAIDPATDRVVARYTVPCEHPHGFLIDEPRRLAFVSCEGDARLLVVDLRTMRTIATHHVGDDPDVLAFDPGLGRLYVACESGVVSVFDERDRVLIAVGDYRAPHAHSVAVDPATHRVYLPLDNVGGRPALSRILAFVFGP